MIAVWLVNDVWSSSYYPGTVSEDSMKHKGERHIPDFSKKPKTAHPAVPDQHPQNTRPPARTPQPKPQSTSSKSGRRGQ